MKNINDVTKTIKYICLIIKLKTLEMSRDAVLLNFFLYIITINEFNKIEIFPTR